MGCFTESLLEHWRLITSNQWLLTTLLGGYRIQFCCRPPVHTGMRQTIVHDPCQTEALAHKVKVLLRKGVIELVDPQIHPRDSFNLFSGHQEGRQVSANLRLEKSESVPSIPRL